MTQAAAGRDTPLLQMQGIDKSFPGVHALKGIDLTLMPGEVLALLGENGAGKSTLIKVLGGAHQPDRGSIEIEGEVVSIDSPADAIRTGIGIIYQEFNLVPALSAWENIFLGRERTTAGFIRRRDERRRAQELFDRIGVRVPIDAPCGSLSVAQQQIVEIAKALSQEVRIIVMDEPSATLTPAEVSCLFDIIRDLRAQGIGVIYISHRLDEIFQIANRVSVIRDGESVGTVPIEELTRERMIEMMVGRKIDNEFPKHRHPIGDTRLQVTDLGRGQAVRQLSFEVRRGEVLGVTGLVGSGRTEAARLIFGADQADTGTITLDGVPLSIRSPRDAIGAGICLLTEDRKSQGLILGMSVRENFGLPNLPEFSVAGFIREEEEAQAFAGHVDALSIKIPHHEQAAGNLSGGNQQKVVLAKWLQRNAELIIFDEPTRGIDVGAKVEIYELIGELVEQGVAILLISSEMSELIGLADRVAVIHEGALQGVLPRAEVTQERIMELALG